jgi:hypothetical protein
MDLTGTWQCNDGGAYFIRQLGDVVWWYGQRSGDGVFVNGIVHPTQPYWSNVGKGIIGKVPIPTTHGSAHSLHMHWADVPNGKNSGSGELSLLIDPSQDRITNQKPSPNFSGHIWERIKPPR